MKKQVLTMSRLKYHLHPRISDIKKLKNPSSTLLRMLLFKKLLPIEIGFMSFIIFLAAYLLVPSITAASSPTTPAVVMLPMPSAVISQSYEENLNPYKTDEEGYQSEIAYSQALRIDAERRFYTGLARGSHRIVDAVYEYAKDLNKDLVFALILQESSFKSDAINENIDRKTGEVKSVDRGLFQLNSNSYPDLSEDEVFQIETNVKYGIAHIRGELKYWNGNVKKALWTYNAGQNGISDQVPKKTLAYAKEIIETTQSIKISRERYIKESLTKYLVVSVITRGDK